MAPDQKVLARDVPQVKPIGHPLLGWLLPAGVLCVAYSLLYLAQTPTLTHTEIMSRCVLVDANRARIWSVGNVEIGLAYFGVFLAMLYYFMRVYVRNRRHMTDLSLAMVYLCLSFTLDYYAVKFLQPFWALVIGDGVVITFTALVSRKSWFQRLLGVFVPTIFLTCGIGHFLEGLAYWHRTYPLTTPWTMVTADIGFAVLLNSSRFPAFLRGEDVVEELVVAERRASTLQAEIDARRAAEDDLIASETRYRSLFETMTSGVTYLTKEGIIADLNPTAERLLGKPASVLRGASPASLKWKFIHPDGTVIAPEDMPSAICLRTGQPVEERLMGMLQPENGALKWLMVQVAPETRPGERDPFRARCLFEDVTDRLKQDAERKRNEARLTALIASAADAVITVDGRQLIVVFNPAAVKMFGYEPFEVIGQRLSLLLPERFREAHELHFARFLWSGATERRMGALSVLAARRRDGSEFPIEVTISQVTIDEEVLCTAIVRDVTERRRAEVALRESEQRQRLALETGGSGAWELDTGAGEFLDMSDASKSLFGLPLSVTPRWTDCLERMHPDDVRQVESAIAETMASGATSSVQFRVMLPDNAVRWLSVHAGSMQSLEPSRPRLIGVMQDITERKLLEKERERALIDAEARADNDPLTGLLNHRAFLREVESRMSGVHWPEQPRAVALLDLDNFKYFNDVHGHSIGDEVLCRVGERLRETCGVGAAIARYGGDEFAVLLDSIGEESARQIEARLGLALSELEYRPPAAEGAIPIMASIGAAVIVRGPGEVAANARNRALDIADERLRRAKTGRETETEAQRVRTRAGVELEGFSMIDALVNAVDNKDRYTRRHSEDVMGYCLMIAHQLGIDPALEHDIAVAALLHDVGKIGIPDAVLRKPGKLSPDEYAAIQQHPRIGAILLSAAPGLEPAVDAVLHHHERWDGAGYPDGLAGEEISLVARLMAVADAFSAMTTSRPYRKSMDAATARTILKEGAGTQWDPRCVEAFLAAIGDTGIY